MNVTNVQFYAISSISSHQFFTCLHSLYLSNYVVNKLVLETQIHIVKPCHQFFIDICNHVLIQMFWHVKMLILALNRMDVILEWIC